MLIGIEVLPTTLVMLTSTSIRRIQGSTDLLYVLMLLCDASPDGQCELVEVKEMRGGGVIDWSYMVGVLIPWPLPSGLEVGLEDIWCNIGAVWIFFNLPSGLDTLPFREEGIWHHNFCQYTCRTCLTLLWGQALNMCPIYPQSKHPRKVADHQLTYPFFGFFWYFFPSSFIIKVLGLPPGWCETIACSVIESGP